MYITYHKSNDRKENTKKIGYNLTFEAEPFLSISLSLTVKTLLKITEKVSFNIASEASYVYILSGQKLIKNAKNGSILASFLKLEACGQTVLPDRSVLIGQKLVENAKNEKFKCDILGDFQTLCFCSKN